MVERTGRQFHGDPGLRLPVETPDDLAEIFVFKKFRDTLDKKSALHCQRAEQNNHQLFNYFANLLHSVF